MFIAGDQGSGSAENSEEMFRSGFHLCAKEVLQYLANKENSQDMTPLHVMRHLQKVSSELLHGAVSPRREEPTFEAPESPEKPPSGPQPKAPEGHAKNCVPVIQRTYTHTNGEQSGSDTDTDSGYGGELEKRDGKAHPRPGYYKEAELGKYSLSERVKQESDEPPAKRQRSDSSEDESTPAHEAVAGHGGYVGFSPHQPPLCMPFYLIPPSTAAAYLPMLDKCWYPGGMPVLYPGMGGSPPSLSPEKLPPSLVMSPRVGSPTAPQTPMDSPALLQALKQVPPLNLETKD